MKTLTFPAMDSVEAAVVIGCCGSLGCRSRGGPFSDLVAALKRRDQAAVETAARLLIKEAVPEEGEIHPRRALLSAVTPDTAAFTTPAGVIVEISIATNPIASHSSQLHVAVDFGRDSTWLASEMLAHSIFRSGNHDHAVMVDGTITTANKALASALLAMH